MPSLSISGLSKSFRHVRAVDDLSFTVDAGEIVALLGPNGAGKSTTFQCLAGLLRPDSGEFVWDSRTLGGDRGRTLGLIPETPDVYPLLTVWEHLVFVARSCKIGNGWEDRAQTLLRRFNLLDQRDTLGSALSKGMRQKTLVAATLLADAPVLLFDEPMIGLDPAGQRELRELLFELRDAGKAIVVSTHMLDVAEIVGTRAIIMKKGRSIFSGTFGDLHAQHGADLESIFLQITA